MRDSDEFSVVKSPFNLQTSQRRLRHLQSIAVRNLHCPNAEGVDFCTLQVFFTLHKEATSKAFYTSEKITGSLNPTWQSFDLQLCESEVDLTSKFVVVRVWVGYGLVSKVKIECHVQLSGLVYFADKLQVSGVKHSSNTLLFGLHGHIFFNYDPATTTPQLEQLILDKEIPRNSVPAVSSVDQSLLKSSYNTNYLSRIHTVRRAIKQTNASVRRIHSSIEDKLLSSSETSLKLSTREMLVMKVRQLRQELLWQTQQVHTEEEKLEKFKLDMDQRIARLKDKNEELQRHVARTEENRTMHIQSREMLVKENAQLQFRRKQIISEMVHYIYPITEDDKQNFYIAKTKLPNAEDYQGQDEARVAVALGFTCHLTQMVSHFMDMPLRYPMLHRGSRSIIIDHVLSKLAEKDREFPLFGKGKEKFQFNYAVFLLNKNISQLRFCCGMGTQDLRLTLPNLKSFMEQRVGVRTSGSVELRKISPLLSPPTTSIDGSNRSRRSQGPSSPTSVSVQRDFTWEQEPSPVPDSGTSSLQGGAAYSNSMLSEGVSLTDLEGTSGEKAGPAVPHNARPMSDSKCSSTWTTSAVNGHAHQVDTNGAIGENVIEEEDEELFKPSEDSFFKVSRPPEIQTFQQSAGTDTSVSVKMHIEGAENGIVPSSEVFGEDTMRTFKLVRSVDTPVAAAPSPTNSSDLRAKDIKATKDQADNDSEKAVTCSPSHSYSDGEMYICVDKVNELQVLD